jgi:hypothetical protein
MLSKARMILFLSFYIFSISLYANPVHEEGYEYKQKLILLQGKKSRLIDGHTRPSFNFNKREVLPYYLARGWTIQHIYFDESDIPGERYAYVVIEKWQKLNKRFSHRR